MLRWPVLWLTLVLALAFEFDVTNDYATSSDNGTIAALEDDASLFWGAYRLGNYFATRPRTPWLLMLGLMWYSLDDYEGISNIRHSYDQGDATIAKANWVQFDPRIGGREVIVDNKCHYTIYIDFVKSEDGQSWATKVTATPHKGFEHSELALVWYLGLEGEKVEGKTGYIEVDTVPTDSHVGIRGISEELGMFNLDIFKKGRTPKVEQDFDIDGFIPGLHHLSLNVPDGRVWQARDIFATLVQELVEEVVPLLQLQLKQAKPNQLYIMRNLHHYQGNMHFVQGIYQGKAQMTVLFNSELTPQSQRFTPDNLKLQITKALAKINDKYHEVFTLNPPFTSKDHQKFAQECVSGLMGGLSYFYGDQLVDRDTKLDDLDDDEGAALTLDGKFEGPYELFTLVPLRPFFPRGFYWDEGFHLLPLLRYDPKLVMDILTSWFDLMDDDGWIAREQILGPELRSRVPPAFQVQSPEIVNPPTLMLAFVYLLELLEANGLQDNLISLDDFRHVYPRLKQHFDFIRTTQIGMKDEFDRPGQGYRWRGRTATHCLASGLDDYPRPQPMDVAELHVDLLSWVGVMARSLKLMAHHLDIVDDQQHFADIEHQVESDLVSLHWSEADGCFCDVSVDEDDEDEHVCHKGYISIFPFLTKLINVDDHDKIGRVLTSLADPEELWTPYGIRSLSKSDPEYRTGENYWKSPIWVQMNYLVLDALQYYHPHLEGSLKAQAAKVYRELRENVVNNVYGQWKRLGYVWEQYDDETGHFKGAKNFLGWTSLVVMMMEMPQQLE